MGLLSEALRVALVYYTEETPIFVSSLLNEGI